MTAATPNNRQPRWEPARPGWVRLSLLTSVLLIGWALLVPPGHRAQWWHLALALAITAAFLGSWHGQSLSTIARRSVPMALRNRQRRRRPPSSAAHRNRGLPRTSDTQTAEQSSGDDEATIVIHLQPHPYELSGPNDTSDQLPWELVISWLDRYGIRANALTVTSVNTTPPASSLRSDHSSLLSAATPQNRHTWISYTLGADANLAAISAGRVQRIARRSSSDPQTDPQTSDDDTDSPRTAITELAAITARRLVAELSEQGWLASDVTKTQLPRFADATLSVRRECWTGAEYADGFRAVYQIEPHALGTALDAITRLHTKSSWVSVTVRQHGFQPPTIEAAAALLTTARPSRRVAAGMHGMHGLHAQSAERFTVTGLAGVNLPRTPVVMDDLRAVLWRTSSAGVPLGSDQHGDPFYLTLDSPEPTRITITGTPEFQWGICSRLVLLGRPTGIYAPNARPWVSLANLAAPHQVSLNPSELPPDAIAIGADGAAIPPAAIAVILRPSTPTYATSTPIMITQHPRQPDWFTVSTPRLRERSSPRLGELVNDFRAKYDRDPDAAQRRTLAIQASSVWLNTRLPTTGF
ncbi:hypothetical protein [Mycobacterium servetii]|uniref:Type VII secretion protein EccE n=1 Tax=Mycobacterium servetii TaxID=3237418 RepID=A0ABV4CCD1_9MYCO